MCEKKSQDKEIMEKLAGKELSEQEIFEAKTNLINAFNWLFEMDKKYNPQLYENK